MPKWATPERKAHLLRLTGVLLDFGPDAPLVVDYFSQKLENLIRHWVAQDRADAEALWRLERARMHQVPDSRFRQGRFDTIRRAEFLAQQPSYYLGETGVDGLTFRPVAKVRIPSTYIVLFVDIGPALQGMGKNARRKALRYHGLTPEATVKAGKLIRAAVKGWWSR